MAIPNIPWLPASLLPSKVVASQAVNLPDEYNRTTATDDQLKDQLEAERKKNYRSGRTVILEDGRVVPEEEEQQALDDIKAKKEIAKWERGTGIIQNITDILTLGGAGAGMGAKAAAGYMNRAQPVRMSNIEPPELGVAQANTTKSRLVPTPFELHKDVRKTPMNQRTPYMQSVIDIEEANRQGNLENTFYENPKNYSPWHRTPNMRPVAEFTPRQHLEYVYKETLDPQQVRQNLIPSANYFRPVEEQITEADLDTPVKVFTEPQRASGGASGAYYYGADPYIVLYPENILRVGGTAELLDTVSHETTHAEQTARNRAAGNILQRVLNPPKGVSLSDKPYAIHMYDYLSSKYPHIKPDTRFYKYDPYELQEFIWSPMKRFSSRANMLYGVHGTPDEQLGQVKGFINKVFNTPQLFEDLGDELFRQQFGHPKDEEELEYFKNYFLTPFLLDVFDTEELQKEAIKGAMAKPIKKEKKYG